MDESLTSKIEELEGEIDKMKLSKTHQIGMLTSIYSTVQYIKLNLAFCLPTL